MRRGPDIAVRRALGASRGAIYAQYLVEAGVIGLVGGLLGVLLTAWLISRLDLVFETKIARIVHSDTSTMALAIVLAIVVTLIAATYPVWRVSGIQPALQLKAG
jgi:putative ABC transport system permease protein